MKQEGQDKTNKIVSFILLFLWCSLIFYFSSQVGNVSEKSSSNIILILNSLLKIFSFDIDLTKSTLITFIIRKLAHMFLYFILYYLCFYVSNSYKFKKKRRFCILYCFLFAISDEIHQLFVVGRSFGIQDVFIDMLGTFLAYLISRIVFQREK